MITTAAKRSVQMQDPADPYPEFVLRGCEWHRAKRDNDRFANEDGEREYAFFRCPHGDHEVCVVVAAGDGSVNKNKGSAVRDHLADDRKCPLYTGERPAKSKRGSKRQAAEPATIGDDTTGRAGGAFGPVVEEDRRPQPHAEAQGRLEERMAEMARLL